MNLFEFIQWALSSGPGRFSGAMVFSSLVGAVILGLAETAKDAIVGVLRPPPK